MTIVVKVKAGAHEDSIEYDDRERTYSVCVRKRAVAGKANEAVITLLSGYLGKPKSQITLKSGHRSAIKRFEIIG